MLPASKTAATALGERFRSYKDEPTDRESLREYRRYRCQGIAPLLRQVAEAIAATPAVLSCRVKRLDTIVRKLNRQQEMSLPRMDDILGFRIVCASYAVQLDLRTRIRERVNVRREKDYTIDPALTGYRALHLALTHTVRHPTTGIDEQYTCELQIRTHYQNLWATLSESFGEQVKEGGGTTEEREYLLELSRLVREFSEANPAVAQINDLAVAASTHFSVVHYNKNKNEVIRWEHFGEDVDSALRQVDYLEDLNRQDLARETVLLGAPVESELEVTHARYFQPGGRPEIPSFLMPTRPRPA